MGPEGANAVLRWLRGAFDDLSYEILDAFADGDRVAMRHRDARNAHGRVHG